MLVHKLLSVAEVTGQGVLYLLIALSVISIGIIIERAIWFARRRLDAGAFGRELTGLLARDERAGLRRLLSAHRSVEVAALGAALEHYQAGPEAFVEVLQAESRERRKEAEAGLLYLGTLGSNAPFVGLFGTVLGIVTAFKELATASSQGMGNVMSGISEALVATAVGILVAIPAVVAYNWFQKAASNVEDNVTTLGNHVLALMKAAPTRAKAA
jgi:biopolymer transport protein ExbB/biopolymer transport protein TolQ